jgi:hypothetical protein
LIFIGDDEGPSSEIALAQELPPQEPMEPDILDEPIPMEGEPFGHVVAPSTRSPFAAPKRLIMYGTDFPTARRGSWGSSKVRCPHCKRAIVHGHGNPANITPYLAKGGPIRDVSGRKQTALGVGVVQLEFVDSLTSFVGSADTRDAQRRSMSQPDAPEPFPRPS